MKHQVDWAPSPEVQILTSERVGDKWLITATARGPAKCPDCMASSSSFHSSYLRHLQDLPQQGSEVVLSVRVQRWRCRNPACLRRTFGTRLPQTARTAARRTDRVHELVRVLGHATGGRPAERLLARLGMAMSDDTILRRLKQAVQKVSAPARVVGIDDWAWVKGQVYGTLIVDLERRKVIDLLADRSAASSARWFAQHPEVEIISRDRCGMYACGARQGAPQARQVADRFHLLQNLRDSIERQMSRPQFESKVKPDAIVTSRPTKRGRLPGQVQQDEARRFKRALREDHFDRVKALQRTGQTLNEIIRQTGFNWRTVSKWCALDVLPDRNRILPGSGVLAQIEDHVSRRWQEGEERGHLLLEEARALGYQGSRATFYRLLAALRLRYDADLPAQTQPGPCVDMEPPNQFPKPIDPQTGRVISPILAAALCMKPRSLMTVNQTRQIAVLKRSSTDFERMRSFVMRLRAIMRAKSVAGLDEWIDEARRCGVHAMQQYARTLNEDLDAVRNAVTEPWSNGQAEGQINRLKTIKRSMYGRAGIDLLRARMLPVSGSVQHIC